MIFSIVLHTDTIFVLCLQILWVLFFTFLKHCNFTNMRYKI
uniref:Uncharacterized protein n=1 Tax=Anguilla anguilla TaxID=7936 RepID=A0A0E9UD02_ANGAN